jgi:hypothetical protein
MDPNESKPKTFESRYLVAQRNLRKNFSAINNIQKGVEQLKLAARTSVSSDDFTSMNIKRMKLLNQIGFIIIGNIRLMKDLHQLTEQQLNDSKRYEIRSSSMHKMVTYHSIEHQEIETLLNQLDDWYKERKADRLRLKALKKQVDAFQITKSFIPSFDESLRHLELIQAQLDLDKKIQQMSDLIDYAVTVCERKSDEMDAKSKTKLEKSKKQEVRYIQQEKASSQLSSPQPSIQRENDWRICTNGSNLPHLLTNCKHYSGHQNAARWTNPHQSHLLALQQVEKLTYSPGKPHQSAHMTDPCGPTHRLTRCNQRQTMAPRNDSQAK